MWFHSFYSVMLRSAVHRARMATNRNPSLLWKVPLVSSIAVGGTSWLGWSWLMGMSPVHVVEQSLRSMTTLYAVSNIAIDYKFSLRNYPNFEELRSEASTNEETRQIDELEAKWNLKWDKVHQRGAERLLWVCQQNAGIFTKAGQHIASLNHILPAQYTNTLSVLQDRAPFVPLSDVEQVFKEDLHLHPSDIFASFEEEPIAAASLAQVHKAKLKTGETVAVKVQYPKLSRMVEGDMKTIETIVTLIAWLFPSFEFRWTLPEFEENIMKELDFRVELANSERAETNFKKDNTKGVYIPAVHRALSSKRILVMEFIDGVKVTNVKGLRELGLDPKDVTDKIMNLFSDQIFLHGFVHCDPHPGNILVRNKKGLPEIVLLDHGLYRELKEEFRINYCKLWKALVLRDAEGVAKYAQMLGAGEFADLFSVMLTLKPPSSELTLDDNITKGDLMEIASLLQCSRTEFAEMLRNMDRDLLFVLRTTYLLQSINLELGGEVNRFTIMARHSIQGTHTHTTPLPQAKGIIPSLKQKFGFWTEKILFEINLALANGFLALFMRSSNIQTPSHPQDKPNSSSIHSKE